MPKIIDEETLLGAAARVVGQRGYAAATTKEIAAAAQVSEVTLFRRYDSKAKLVGRALEVVISAMDFDDAVRYSGDLRADLTRIVGAYQQAARQYGQFLASLMADMGRDADLTKLMAAPLGLIERIAALVQRYQEEGQLAIEPPLHTVLALLSPMIYAGMVANARPGQPLPPLDPDTHIAHFLAGRAKTE